jgi:triacylglycerol lipase
MIAAAVNLSAPYGESSDSMYSDLALSHFGLTADEQTVKTEFSLKRIINYIRAKDNAGVDLTVGGSQKLNEKIKMNPDTYYYSYSGTVTEENKWGRQKKTHDTTSIFNATTLLLTASQGLIIDGIKMDKDWANNDGMVPLKSALYPLDEKDNAFSYEEALSQNSIKPGSWYYLETMYGMDHFDFCGTKHYPTSFEDFYFGMVDMANSR